MTIFYVVSIHSSATDGEAWWMSGSARPHGGWRPASSQACSGQGPSVVLAVAALRALGHEPVGRAQLDDGTEGLDRCRAPAGDRVLAAADGVAELEQVVRRRHQRAGDGAAELLDVEIARAGVLVEVGAVEADRPVQRQVVGPDAR